MNRVIVKAIDYIMNNIDKDLTVEEISNHCHYSKYYFNRMFKETTGESIYAFIKRLRVQDSALKIANLDERTITEISSDYGYSSSNYSSLFKKHYGISPNQFRKKRSQSKVFSDGENYHADLTNESWEAIEEKMSIVKLEDFEVIFKRYIGDYHNLVSYWKDFINTNEELFSDESVQIEFSYDDPIISDSERCIMDLCVIPNKKLTKNYLTMKIQGGKYCVSKFEVNDREIFKVFQSIVHIWMPKTKMKLDFNNRKIFVKYIEVDINKNHFVFKIYIPVL